MRSASEPLTGSGPRTSRANSSEGTPLLQQSQAATAATSRPAPVIPLQAPMLSASRSVKQQQRNDVDDDDDDDVPQQINRVNESQLEQENAASNNNSAAAAASPSNAAATTTTVALAGGDTNSITERIQRVTEHYLVDTMVQLGLETLSPFGSKLMLYSWYAVLIVAMCLQADLNWQYTCNDVCRNDKCVLGKINKIPDVTSTPCASVRTIVLDGSTSSSSASHGDGGGGDPSLSVVDGWSMLMAQRSAQKEEEQQHYDGGRASSYRRGKDHHHHQSSSGGGSSNFFKWQVLPGPVTAMDEREALEYHLAHPEETEAMLMMAAAGGAQSKNSNGNGNNNNDARIGSALAIVTASYCSSGNASQPAQLNRTACGISWAGGFGNIIDSKLNRFVHLRFAMPRPNQTAEEIAAEGGIPAGGDGTDTEINFQMSFILAVKNGTAVSDKGERGANLLTRVPVRCRADEVECDAVTIPVVFGSVTNASTFVLLAYDVPTLAYISAMRLGAVQAVFQSSGYTIATIVVRYVFFVACVIQLIQLLHARYTIWNHLQNEKRKKERREAGIRRMQRQAHMAKLQRPGDAMAAAAAAIADQRAKAAGLPPFDPVAAVTKVNSNNGNNESDTDKLLSGGDSRNSTDESNAAAAATKEKEHLGAFEQNWATLLNAMLLLYMNPFYAVSVYVVPTPGFFDFLEYKLPLYFVITVVLCVLALCLATLETKPSALTRVSLVLMFLLLLVLDLTDAGRRGWHFNTVECVNFECSGLRWAIIVIIVIIILIIACLLLYLHRNLAQLPYLATRPRQLSMRLIIFIFTSYVVYYVVSTCVGYVLYASSDLVDQSHSELRIGTLCCAFAFVSIITTAFKFVLRTDRIPPHPSDQRWKKVVWSPAWYTWLSLHGGGGYIFFSESEEEDFDIVQETKQDNISDYDDDDEHLWAEEGKNAVDDAASNKNGGGAAAAASIASAVAATTDYDAYSDSASATNATRPHVAVPQVGVFGAGGRVDGDDDEEDDEIARAWKRRREKQHQQQQQSPHGTRPRGHSRTASRDAAGFVPRTVGGAASPTTDTATAYDSPDYAFASGPFSQGGGSTNFSSPNQQSYQQQPQQQRGYPTHSRTQSGSSDDDNKSSLSARVFRRVDSFTSIDDKTFSKVLRRPARIIERMEDTVLGAANLFRLVSSTRPAFMNLETAIDLFNLSYEAYGVAVSKGDAKITTGITVTEAYEKTKNIVCCCCEYDDKSSSTPTAAVGAYLRDGDERSGSGIYASSPTTGLYTSHGRELLENQSFDFGNSPTSDDLGMFSNFSTTGNSKANTNKNRWPGAAASRPTAPNTNNLMSPTQQKQQIVVRGAAGAAEASTPPGEGRSMTNMTDGKAAVTTTSSDALGTPRASAASTVAGSGNERPPINTEQYGYKQRFVHEAGNVQVVISEMDAATCPRHQGKYPRFVVAFRGTDNQDNLKEDFRFTREVFGEMHKELSFVNSILEAKVHAGFLKCWMALQHEVLDKVAELINEKPSNRWHICGHSLGGAIAGLCAYTIATRFKAMLLPPTAADHNKMVQCYTYGMPKLGDRVFRDEYDKKIPYTFRIVNESDTVSGVGVFMGHHVGKEVCIDRHGNFIVDPMPVEKLFRPTQGTGLSLKHHSMYAYGSSLNRIAAHTQFGFCPSRCLDPYVPTAATLVQPQAYKDFQLLQNLSNSGLPAAAAASPPSGVRASSGSRSDPAPAAAAAMVVDSSSAPPPPPKRSNTEAHLDDQSAA